MVGLMPLSASRVQIGEGGGSWFTLQTGLHDIEGVHGESGYYASGEAGYHLDERCR